MSEKNVETDTPPSHPTSDDMRPPSTKVADEIITIDMLEKSVETDTESKVEMKVVVSTAVEGDEMKDSKMTSTTVVDGIITIDMLEKSVETDTESKVETKVVDSTAVEGDEMKNIEIEGPSTKDSEIEGSSIKVGETTLVKGQDSSSIKGDGLAAVSSSSKTKNNDMSIAFLLKPPASISEVDAVEKSIRGILSSALKAYDEGGAESLQEYINNEGKGQDPITRNKNDDKEKSSSDETESLSDKNNNNELISNRHNVSLDEESMRALKINGAPRMYQQKFFELAQTQNTIVNLGTGKGKTFIALLCIRHFSTAFQKGKQTWFLVPSIALAVQQSMIIKANLPFKVGVASNTAPNSELARSELASADILVATHGCALDLLRHYGNMFSLEKVNYLIFDECHYATKKHNYAVIMEKFYHKLSKEKRPRVLGLTASPLINAKPKVTEDGLDLMLSDLERMLDSKLASLSSLDLPESGSGIIHHNVEEKTIEYCNQIPSKNLPTCKNIGIHPTREKELDLLEDLYSDLGPRVTGVYCLSLVKEIARNRFDKETLEQHKIFLKHLESIKNFCLKRCHSDSNGGRTGKLMALEKLILGLVEAGNIDEFVGIIFVERRITALALYRYLQKVAEMHIKNPRQDKGMCHIKCDILTRQTTKVFKYLHPNHKLSASELKAATEEWLHVMKKTKDVLDRLRRKEINVLISTSVVEEGVDVDACSFVIVLDSLKTTKSYVQMKGRARMRDAKFFVFQDTNPKSNRAPVTLLQAFEIESRVNTLIRKRKNDVFIHTPVKRVKSENGVRLENGDGIIIDNNKILEEGEVDTEEMANIECSNAYLDQMEKEQDKMLIEKEFSTDPLFLEDELLTKKNKILTDNNEKNSLKEYTIAELEMNALLEGEYSTAHALVDLTSAKSLINRYALSIPMDALSRTSRESLLLHMPVFEDNHLMLPAHLPNNIRYVGLPEEHQAFGKKLKRSMLSLMACVRLHKIKVLNDHLLPLKRNDMHEHLTSITLKQFTEIKQNKLPPQPPKPKELKKIYLYPVVQTGTRFAQHESILHNENRLMGILSLHPLPDFPNFCFDHNELSRVRFQIGPAKVVDITGEEWIECSQFYCAIINCRWRKRTGRIRFMYSNDTAICKIVPSYVIGALKSDYSLDWERMRKVLKDYSRGETERKTAVEVLELENDIPRLISPIYDPNVTYICYGVSGLTCAADFPHHEELYTTYHDYMLKKRGFSVPIESKLLVVQRLWQLPRRMREVKDKAPKRKLSQRSARFHELREGQRAPCEGLGAALLPQQASLETPLRDAALYLHCVLLPQAMYHIDQVLITRAFIEHCKKNLPVLGACLEKIPLEDVMESITAKSCSMPISYDRLEYLGDAVLKMIQTDALLNSSGPLRKWVNCLHEGDLSALRSAMGSNKRLKDASKSAGLDKFILTRPLGRGQWVPICLEVYVQDETTEETEGEETYSPCINEEFIPSEKVCADVVEALLGLVYLNFGFKSAVAVAEDIGISLAQKKVVEDTNPPDLIPRQDMVEKCKGFLGQGGFHQPHLLYEATTHPSCIHSEVPCYQKLEWIGDAVVCLAAREKLYLDYPQLQVADLVVIETTIVCNETLAVLGFAGGLYDCINHCDASLPMRLEDFKHYLTETERGLWGLNPPKVLADVVEALLGAVHVEKGFGDGQQAALFVISPFTTAISVQLDCNTQGLTQAKAQEMMHPKQVLKQIAKFLQVRGWKEEDFASRHPKCPVWCEDHWTIPSLDGNGGIGQITCCGMNVVAVLEKATSVVAKNRVCAIASSILIRSPELLEDLQKIATHLRPEK